MTWSSSSARRLLAITVVFGVWSCGGSTKGDSGSGADGGGARPASGGRAGASGGASGASGNGGFPTLGGATCADALSFEACESDADCHSVFDDAGTCDCEVPGCCARFSYCAPGSQANCVPPGLLCRVVEPYCEAPAYVIAYSGSCFEGCVDPKDCAP